MRVAIIGNFDGVHRGHQALVAQAASQVAKRGGSADPTASQVAKRGGSADPTATQVAEAGGSVVAVSFFPHPIVVLRPDRAPALLTLPERRAELLRDAGADDVVLLAFTPELAAMSPEEFARLVKEDPRIRADVVVVGENFRFGRGAAGGADTLRTLGEDLGFEVDVVSLAGSGISDGTAAWSSTLVRERIAAGDVAGAADVLGRPHRVEGLVSHGDRRGRDLGYPTANLRIDPAMAVPADGVYAGYLVVDPHGAGERFPAAISVGTNPQFGGAERRVEAHALGRDDLDLYGRPAAVDFVARLRGQEVFSSVADLVAQMGRDVDAAERALTAG